MNVLRDLQRFIAAKAQPEEAHEVLEEVIANAERYAPAFGVSPEALMVALIRPESDVKIVALLLGTIMSKASKKRERGAKARSLSAQESADALGSAATWEGAQVNLDVAALLAAALTKGGDLLVFRAEGSFDVAVSMRLLLAFAKLKRSDVSGFVDASGLHLRWKDGKAGLNLKSRAEGEADVVVVNLQAREAAVAA